MAEAEDRTRQSIRILASQMRRCSKLLHKLTGTAAWRLRDDLAKASRALVLKDVPEMSHMVAILRGHGEEKGD